MEWIIARLKEKTTYAGIFSLLAALGVTVVPEQAEAITTAAIAIIGAVLVFVDEKKEDE
jgi:hypothetical protein